MYILVKRIDAIGSDDEDKDLRDLKKIGFRADVQRKRLETAHKKALFKNVFEVWKL